jgi:hypothetical protein
VSAWNDYCVNIVGDTYGTFLVLECVHIAMTRAVYWIYREAQSTPLRYVKGYIVFLFDEAVVLGLSR